LEKNSSAPIPIDVTAPTPVTTTFLFGIVAMWRASDPARAAAWRCPSGAAKAGPPPTKASTTVETVESTKDALASMAADNRMNEHHHAQFKNRMSKSNF